MNYEIVNFKEVKVEGEHVRISNNDPNMSFKFNELWQGFYQNPTSLSYDVLAGVASTNGTVSIQNGQYARFEIIGNPMTAPAILWQEIWKTKLNRACMTDFELYYPNPDIEKTRIEIYIGLTS